MSFGATLFSGDILCALAVLLAGGLVELPLEYWVKRRVAGAAVLAWWWDALGAPMLRAVIVIAAVLLAYPALFGLRSAPPLGSLLVHEDVALDGLVNLVFVASLVLPLLPPFRHRVGLVVLAQGTLATAVVFGWYTHWLGAHSVGVWPGFAPAVVVGGLGVACSQLGEIVGHTLGRHLDQRWDTEGLALLVPHAAGMVAPIPAILVYGYALGERLAA